MVNRYMDDYGPGDMSTPEVKLIQATGGKIAKDQGATPGDFYLPLTDEVIIDGMDIVIADILKTRTYWGRSEIDNEPPECTSSDARSMRSIFGNDCAVCDKRVEQPGLIGDKDERRKMCAPGYTIIAIRADESRMPLLIRATGMNATPTRELITVLKINRQIKGAYEKVLIHLSSHAVKTASGESFVMAFKPKAIINDEKSAEFLLQTQQLLGAMTALPEAAEMAEIPAEIPVSAEEAVTGIKGEIPPGIAKPKAKAKAAAPAPQTELPVTDLKF